MGNNTIDFNAIAGRLNAFEEKQKALDAEREALRADVLAECRRYAQMFHFTAKELGVPCEADAPQTKRSRTGSGAKAKYKNPDGEETWSGRGPKKPDWFVKAIEAGFEPKDMLIEQPSR